MPCTKYNSIAANYNFTARVQFSYMAISSLIHKTFIIIQIFKTKKQNAAYLEEVAKG